MSTKNDQQPTEPENNNQAIALDPELRRFLRDVCSGQCLALGAWAARILRAGQMTFADLTRCFVLGFEG